MSHARHASSKHIGDPVAEAAPLPRAKLEEIFADIQADLRYDHELNGCLNCGICRDLPGRATTTSARARSCSFSGPRTSRSARCKKTRPGPCTQRPARCRCPFNSPGGLVMLMRETAIKHQMKSAKDVLRPFSRVMLKLISTGNQLSPDMINKEQFADWGPNISKVEAPLKLLRKAIPMPTLNTTATAWK